MKAVIGFLIAFFIAVIVMTVLGVAFRNDLKRMEKENPKYRKYLKDKYNI